MLNFPNTVFIQSSRQGESWDVASTWCFPTIPTFPNYLQWVPTLCNTSRHFLMQHLNSGSCKKNSTQCLSGQVVRASLKMLPQPNKTRWNLGLIQYKNNNFCIVLYECSRIPWLQLPHWGNVISQWVMGQMWRLWMIWTPKNQPKTPSGTLFWETGYLSNKRISKVGQCWKIN
jgi:hypothetical protein